MAVIASAQTIQYLQHRSVSSSPFRLFPSQFPRASVDKTPLSFKSTNTPNTRPSLLVRASSTSDFIPDIGETLGEISVFRASGESVMFKDLWDQDEGIVVIALLRHFGCFCSWDLASALKESKSRFDSAGVKLMAVGIGSPIKARILAERLPFPMDCLYADPGCKAYNVLGLYYGLGRTLFNLPKVLSRYDSMKKALENYTLEGTPDDKSSILQQGGMFVFKGKQLLYGRRDEGTGDHAPLDDIFDACCRVPAAEA